MLNFIRNCLFCRVDYNFAFPPAMHKSSSGSAFSSAFHIVSIFYFSHLIGLSWNFIIVYILLISADVDHIFMFLFSICISSLMMCLLKYFAHFLFSIGLFPSCWVLRIQYVFCIQILSQICGLKILSPSLWLPLYYLDGGFGKAAMFNFNEVWFIFFFLLWIMSLVSCLRILCLNSVQFFFVFKGFAVLDFTFRSRMHFS